MKIHFYKYTKWIFIILFILGVSACQGNGSQSSPTPTPDPTPPAPIPKDVTFSAFSLSGDKGSQVTKTQLSSNSFNIAMPEGTSLTKLNVTFKTTDSNALVYMDDNTTTPISSPQADVDFTSSHTYTVKSGNDSAKYTVMASIIGNRDLLEYTLTKQDDASIYYTSSPNDSNIINIPLTAPNGTYILSFTNSPGSQVYLYRNTALSPMTSGSAVVDWPGQFIYKVFAKGETISKEGGKVYLVKPGE